MNDVASDLRTNSRIIAAYRERTPGSASLAHEAGELFPSGITHDARNVDPYCVFIQRAAGPHKWDVDGNRYIDYFGGHGALLLGHGHPAVTAAVSEAFADGTQFGASHPREVQWAHADPAPGAIGRAHPLHLFRHRGDVDGGAVGAGVHRPPDADAVQGSFPRLARPDGQRLHQPLRRLTHAGRAAWRGGEVDPAEPGRHRGGARRVRQQQRHCGGDLRTDRFIVRPGAAGCRVLPGIAPRHRTARCAVDPG